MFLAHPELGQAEGELQPFTNGSLPVPIQAASTAISRKIRNRGVDRAGPGRRRRRLALSPACTAASHRALGPRCGPAHRFRASSRGVATPTVRCTTRFKCRRRGLGRAIVANCRTRRCGTGAGHAPSAAPTGAGRQLRLVDHAGQQQPGMEIRGSVFRWRQTSDALVRSRSPARRTGREPGNRLDRTDRRRVKGIIAGLFHRSTALTPPEDGLPRRPERAQALFPTDLPRKIPSRTGDFQI